MLYINNSKTPFYYYDQVVEIAIKNGVEAKRAYIYLAAFGVRGVVGRVFNDAKNDYDLPTKLAVVNNELVKKVRVCKSCKGLVIQSQ